MKTAIETSTAQLFQNPMPHQTHAATRSRKGPLAALTFISLTAVTLFYWWAYKKPVYGIDDANIYFVYMKHLAEGHGFVWTVGGERVEGFTSVLWTLIGAACYKLTPAHFPLLLLALNFVLTFATLFQVLFFVRQLNGTTAKTIALTDVLILALLLFPLGFIEWSLLTLMETGLWIFLIINTTLLLCRPYVQSKKVNSVFFTALVVCMMVTRPEGLLYGALFIFLLAAQTFFETDIRTALRRVAFPLAAFVLTAVLLVQWRLSYFGYPFPNTYYAKVSGNLMDNMKGGAAYFMEFFYNYPHLIFIIGVLLWYVGVFVQRFWKERLHIELLAQEKVQVILLTVIFVGLLAPVPTGGDHFNYSRFYQCIVPLALIAFFNTPVVTKNFAAVQPYNKAVPLFATVIFAGMIFLNSKATWIDFFLPESKVGMRVFRDFTVARRGRIVAEQLNHTFIDNGLTPSTGIIAAGGYGYIYKGTTVDLMGLNSTLMAHASKRKVGPRNHASFDVGAFWKLKPDMVGMFYGAAMIKDTAIFTAPDNEPGFRNSFTYTVYKKIFDQPQFIETYLPALVKLKPDADYLFSYYNKDFLAKLNPAKYDIILLRRNPPLAGSVTATPEDVQ